MNDNLTTNASNEAYTPADYHFSDDAPGFGVDALAAFAEFVLGRKLQLPF